MAWTTPRDWTTGEVVTEAMMDTHVRDEFLYLYDYTNKGVVVKRTTTFATTTSHSVVAWDAEDTDTNAFHDNVTNNTRLTVPAGMGGLYLVFANVQAGASIITFVFKNAPGYTPANSSLGAAETAVSGVAAASLCGPVVLAAADFVELTVYTAGIDTMATRSRFGMYRIG